MAGKRNPFHSKSLGFEEEQSIMAPAMMVAQSKPYLAKGWSPAVTPRLNAWYMYIFFLNNNNNLPNPGRLGNSGSRVGFVSTRPTRLRKRVQHKLDPIINRVGTRDPNMVQLIIG
jgi:hypothetical protein